MKVKICKAANTMLALLLISVAGVPAATAAVPAHMVVAEPMPVMADSPDMDFSKLQISPRHAHIELMPGENDKVTVTVTNKDNKTISVVPEVITRPYSEYIFDETWVTVTPASAELEPDAGEEFTIVVTIPDGDIDLGYYGVQIAFTDDVIQTPYPMPYPNYINVFDLGLEVWKPPTIQVQPSYIHDRVESGGEYEYKIHLKNIGEEDIGIDPEIGGERGYYGWRDMIPAFEDDAITIDAPSVVPAGGTATVNMHLVVPDGAKGGYEGGLNLNIDDPSINDWEGGVHLGFDVWSQPTEPFTKAFTTKIAAPITIEITSSQYQYDMCGGGSSTDDEEPSFDVTLKGPSGDDVTLSRTMAAYQGSVDLGGSNCAPPWEISSSGMYNEGHTSYIERYTADGAAGDWTLGVLPHYAERFGYTITIGDTD